MLPVVLPRLVLMSTLFQAEPGAGDPAVALQACDLLVTQGKGQAAVPCFEGVRLQYPGTPEAHDAERAVLLLRSWPAAPPPARIAADAGRMRMTEPGNTPYYLLEPYSPKTKERLRLTTWEKLDFGVSAFLYGLSTGAAFGAATQSDSVLAPMVIGSLTYTGLGVAYVNAAHVDRGDLPLALAISSYVPLTAGLACVAANADARPSAALVTASGIVALPIAFWAGSVTDLDPGDMQLVRDAGFWGAVWGVTGALSTESVSSRTVGIAGLVGLYGGLGLGAVLAGHTDVSLERVRVTTWGGYGGAIIGVLIAAADHDTDRGLFAGLAAGSAAGVILALATTGSIDKPPANATFGEAPSLSLRYLEPTLLPIVDREGRTRAQPGVSVMRGRF